MSAATTQRTADLVARDMVCDYMHKVSPPRWRFAIQPQVVAPPRLAFSPLAFSLDTFWGHFYSSPRSDSNLHLAVPRPMHECSERRQEPLYGRANGAE